MHRCHKCGKDVPLATSARRNIRTGAQTGGSGFFRTVAFCPRCDREEEATKDYRALNRSRLVLAGCMATVGITVYLGLVYLGLVSPLR